MSLSLIVLISLSLSALSSVYVDGSIDHPSPDRRPVRYHLYSMCRRMASEHECSSRLRFSPALPALHSPINANDLLLRSH